MKIPLISLVVPKNPQKDWTIGQVLGMSELRLSIGPLLHIRDMITGKMVTAFPMSVDRLVRVGTPQRREGVAPIIRQVINVNPAPICRCRSCGWHGNISGLINPNPPVDDPINDPPKLKLLQCPICSGAGIEMPIIIHGGPHPGPPIHH